MKFQTEKHPPPYLNRRDQYRLLAMFGVLCLVMFAINFAAKPSSWHWLVPPQRSADGQVPALKEIDFRVLAQERDLLPADAFRIVEEEGTPTDDGTSYQTELREVDIPADVLSPIEDNTVGLRRKELAAYQFMLSRIDTLPDDVIAKEARDDVAFTVLMLQSDDSRGHLISVHGDLRRLTEFPAPKESEFDRLYEGWLFTRDSGTNPYRIVFTRRPIDVPFRESLDPPVRVRVTGYFFKRYGYASQGGQHVAPLLIARSAEVFPPPTVIPMDGPELRNVMLAAIGLVALAVSGLVFWFTLSDRRYKRGRLSELASARLDASPDDLAALQQVPVIDSERPFIDENAVESMSESR